MDEKPVDTDRASLVAQFRCEAEAVNAEVFIVSGTDNLVKALNSFCRENGVDMLPAVLPETGIWPDVVQQLTRAGLTLINEFSREQLEESGVGLNAADFGIAETGTLVFLETAADEVRTGTIPTRHIVFLKSCDICPCASEITPEIDAFVGECLVSNKPCRVSMVTGPSRTADIERELTVGVHGPKELIIFILDTGDNI